VWNGGLTVDMAGHHTGGAHGRFDSGGSIVAIVKPVPVLLGDMEGSGDG
jgi:hypothetical protein